MIDLDADGARDFKGLDAREAQTALAEELMGEEDDTSEDNKSENEHEDETVAALHETAVDEETAEVTAGEDESVQEEVSASDETSDADPSGGEEGVVDEVAPVEWDEAQTAEHKRMIEALLFAATEPLDVKTIEDRLPVGVDVVGILEALLEDYKGRGINLRQVEKRWRFYTAEDVAHVLEKERVAPRKLSRAALETLAIIAYHQPCTRADIEDVRGVAVAKGSLDQLLEIGWVKLRGKRRDAPGRPTLYGTTPAFLEHFGLENVTDLPGLADLKAAGLLDARLPPGFAVPTPSDHDDTEMDPGDDDSEENIEFVQEFIEPDDEELSDEA